jgi:hypothetical protein
MTPPDSQEAPEKVILSRMLTPTYSQEITEQPKKAMQMGGELRSNIPSLAISQSSNNPSQPPIPVPVIQNIVATCNLGTLPHLYVFYQTV